MVDLRQLNKRKRERDGKSSRKKISEAAHTRFSDAESKYDAARSRSEKLAVEIAATREKLLALTEESSEADLVMEQLKAEMDNSTEETVAARETLKSWTVCFVRSEGEIKELSEIEGIDKSSYRILFSRKSGDTPALARYAQQRGFIRFGKISV